jgi:hypothetical protein
MPTKSVTLAAGVETVCADADTSRTFLSFSNPDDADLIYVSDQAGVGTTGILIAPQMTVVLSILDGWDTMAKHYAYCAGASVLNVGEGTQFPLTWGTVDGDGLPTAPDPAM